MANAAEAPGKRRCKGKSNRGEACRASVVGASGYCAVHDPERPIDMRALGHRGGKARRRGVAEQLPAAERESLREKLRDQLDHNLVKTAIERALAGGNESARVAAVKFLADLELYRKDGNDDQDRQRREAAGEARGKLEAAVARIAAARQAEGQADLAEALEQAARELWTPGEELSGGVVVPLDVTAEQCRATLLELVNVGLIRPPASADEPVVIERLQAENDQLRVQLAAIPQSVREEFVA